MNVSANFDVDSILVRIKGYFVPLWNACEEEEEPTDVEIRFDGLTAHGPGVDRIKRRPSTSLFPQNILS